MPRAGRHLQREKERGEGEREGSCQRKTKQKAHVWACPATHVFINGFKKLII